MADKKGERKEVKVRVLKGALLARFLLHPAGKFLVAVFLLAGIAGLGVFTYYYQKYARIIDQKLEGGPFANTAKIFAAPRWVTVGEEITASEVAAELRAAGYTESRRNPAGWYQLRPDAIEIFPGAASYVEQEAGVIKFADGKIAGIVSLQDNTQRTQFQLEPQLITNLSDSRRGKRRLVHFQDIPPVLINAITSAEDKRFFQHPGFDPIRIAKAIYIDLKERRKDQGASTLSQQLARSMWLNLDKRWSRKLAEMMITIQLEQRLSKEQIFEYYCNEIYLGHRGTFAIHGFGEAAKVYFDKDLSQLTLPEAAMLAGLVQRPMSLNPYRYPERMRERRNVILSLMRQNGHISDREYAVAAETQVTLARSASQSLDAPYFVDLVTDALQAQFQDVDFQSNSYRIYTTLDLQLQRAAAEAVRIGMQSVDEQLKKQRRFAKDYEPQAQAALVALDPRTGEVKALVGGRNYGLSQLNRALAKRQPGSIFKPFVYAAAMDTPLEGGSRILTPSTTVVDQPTTFWFDNKPYEPGNHRQQYLGQVTLRRALSRSLNVATVKVAEMVGYDSVADLARRAGMNYNIHATPSIALGAYEVTPFEIAGAYTIFANHGELAKPNFISMVRSDEGKVIYDHKPERTRVLDPRVSFLMVNLLEEVMRSGTGAGARSLGFSVPAAGKTGTSRDGWFAGFTSELIVVVWVGFDDGRELYLEGARSALPIWTELMKRALTLRQYRNAKPFSAPDGIIAVDVDPLSGMSASPNCPQRRPEVFIAGTQPVGTCPLHGAAGHVTMVAGWDTPAVAAPPVIEPVKPVAAPTAIRASSRVPVPAANGIETPAPPHKEKEEEKKKGLFRRFLGVFK